MGTQYAFIHAQSSFEVFVFEKEGGKGFILRICDILLTPLFPELIFQDDDDRLKKTSIRQNSDEEKAAKTVRRQSREDN